MKKIFASAAAVGLLMSMSANAALIQGSISMSGGWVPVDAANTQTTIGAATGIQFANDIEVTTPAPTFDLSVFSVDTSVAMTDFQFSPLSPSPVSPLYVINEAGSTLTFELESIAIDLQNNSFLVLSGVGIMSLTGFDDTPGVWNFSGQGGQGTFSWSATSFSTVSEPSVLALMGLGLAGLAMFRQRRKGISA